jgi:basic membrane protein A
VGGVESELIKKFEAGFVAGAKAAKPEVTVEVKYLSPEGDFSGFRDPAKGKTVAEGLYDGGADVVYHAAGGSGSGVFEAAVEKSGLAIGVDSDQYQTAPPDQQAVIISSMLKRVDVAVFETIKSFNDGELDGGVNTFDLKSGGIDYSKSGGQIDDITTQIDDFKTQIVDGEVEVPTAPGG